MPSSNAVLGAAVVAGGAYAMYVRRENAQLEREAKEASEEAEKRGRNDAEARKQREEAGGIEAEMQAHVGYDMSRKKELVLLFDLLKCVADAVHTRGGASIELPLLKLPGSPDSPTEAMLGVGLLLGMRADAVQNAVLAHMRGHFRLGLAAGGLMPRTLRQIAAVLKAPPCLGVPTSDLAALDDTTATVLLGLTFFRTDATAAVVRVVTVTLENAVHLRNIAIHLGLAAAGWKSVSLVLSQDRKWVHCKPDLSVVELFRPAANMAPHLMRGAVFDACGGELLLANFDLRSGFKLRTTINGEVISYQREIPVPLTRSGTLQLLPRDTNKGSMFLAQLKVHRYAQVGATRLEQVAKQVSAYATDRAGFISGRGISVEHLAALSGELDSIEEGLLQRLRAGDIQLIERDHFREQLLGGLRRQLILPTSDDEAAAGGAWPLPSVSEQQVEAFVKDYVELVRIRLMHVPCLADGRRPSALVATKPLQSAACAGLLKVLEAPQQRRARELLKDDERQRVLALHAEGTLPRSFSWTLNLVYAALLLWVCISAFTFLRHLPLPGFVKQPGVVWMFSVIAGIVLAFCLHGNLVGLFRSYRWFDLTATDTDRECVRRGRFALYELMAARLGWPTPLERTTRPIETRCQAALRLWLGRIARRRFYAAVNERCIGAHEASALLEDLFTAHQSRRSDVAQSQKRTPAGWRRFWARVRPRKRRHQPKGASGRKQRSGPDGAAKRDPHLRFAVGNRVECCMGRWVSGTVLQLHYEVDGRRYPYQVQVDAGSKIFVPFDDDSCIRAAGEEDQPPPSETALEQEEAAELADDDVPPGYACLPGTLEQAEAFLNLDVDDDDPDNPRGSTVLLEELQGALPMGRPAPSQEYKDYRLEDRTSARRARKVMDVLKERGWVISRRRKHYIYKRSSQGLKQTVSVSSTPSDRRATANILAELDRHEGALQRHVASLAPAAAALAGPSTSEAARETSHGQGQARGGAGKNKKRGKQKKR